jgi:dolichyl-phosphate-mannose-protein mannosyltransferase
VIHFPSSTKDGAATRALAMVGRNAELLAALALACLYLATMSGHLESVDGLQMYLQARSIVFAHSIYFHPALWWGGPVTTSRYGIGLSLLYIPGLLIWSGLLPYVPVYHDQAYHWALYYADPLYLAAAMPVHALITASSAYLVARCIRALGFDRRAALWGLALYGIASPAFVYARGDGSQSLTGLCWIAGLYAALRARQSGALRWSLAGGAAIGYAVLTRLVDGTFLLPAVLLVLLPHVRVRRWSSATWSAAGAAVAGYALGVALNLVVNDLRYGNPLNFGYGSESWTTPLPIGLAGALVSPARGLLWSFPAILLVPLGVRALWRTPHRIFALALVGLAGVELVNTAAWWAWWGGWDWGLRLFVPALTVLAVLAGCGVSALAGRLRAWAPSLLLLGGVVWAVPCILTDLLAGYAAWADGTAGSFNWPCLPADRRVDLAPQTARKHDHRLEWRGCRLAAPGTSHA